jgi:hypothetical protein
VTDDLIPSDVRDFIFRYIDSVAQLEALLLLRNNPTETWDAAKIAKRLYSGERETKASLSQLCQNGLLTMADGIYRYEFESPERADMVDRLIVVYTRHLIPVTNIIHGKPRRIRQFADAFKFRKEP